MTFLKGHKINVGRKMSESHKIKCSIAKLKPRFEKPCILCGKMMIIPKWNLTRKKFCNKDCKNQYQRIVPGTWAGRKLSIEHRCKLALAKKGKKKILSEQAKESFRIKMSGERNTRWIKDRSLLKDDSKDRGGQLHREWSKSVKKRDGWKCKMNSVDCSGRIEAHHVLSWRDYPELRFNINNGITLCHAHHPKKRSEEKRLSPYFMELVSVSKD